VLTLENADVYPQYVLTLENADV